MLALGLAAEYSACLLRRQESVFKEWNFKLELELSILPFL